MSSQAQQEKMAKVVNLNNNDPESEEHAAPTQSEPGSPNKSRTLKDRIKRRRRDSLNASTSTRGSPANLTSSLLSAASPSGSPELQDDRPHEDVFAAASALASLGVHSPATASSYSSARAAARHPVTNSAGGEQGGREGVFTNSAGALLSMVRPPPSLNEPASAARQAVPTSMENAPFAPLPLRPPASLVGGGTTASAHNEPREVSIARPFASILGSDVPLTFPQKVSLYFGIEGGWVGGDCNEGGDLQYISYM